MDLAQLSGTGGMALMALGGPLTAAGAAPGAAPRIAVVAIHDAALAAPAESATRDRFAASLGRTAGLEVLPPQTTEVALSDSEEKARQQALARAEEAAKRGRALYQKIDFENAVKALEQARDLMKGALGAQTDGGMADLLVDLGRAQFDLGRPEAAKDSFKQARVAGAPEEPPSALPPRAKGVWKEAMAALHGLANCGLDVTSEPAAVQLFLDGRPAGRAPLLLRGLAEGQYVVRGELPGHRARVVNITTVAGQSLPIHLVLPPEPPAALDGGWSADELFRGALATGEALGVDYLAAAGFGREGGTEGLRWMVIDVRRRQSVLVGSSATAPGDATAGEAAGLAAGERLSAWLKTNPPLPPSVPPEVQ